MKDKTALVVGEGISGITVATKSALNRIPTTLVEREPSLGGLSASLCCKASESCNKYFATQTELAGVKGIPRQYTVILKRVREGNSWYPFDQ